MKKLTFISVLVCFLCSFPGIVASDRHTGESDDIVRILAFGNSFSEDALDTYFYGVCSAAGKKVVVGNMIIGGCSVDRHLLNVRVDSADYRFRRTGINGTQITVDKVRPSQGMGSDSWDYVCFQQVSSESGHYGSCNGLPELIAFVDSLMPGKTRYMWHQTWAYAPHSKHTAFPAYGSDQHVMYDSIMSACRRVLADNRSLSVLIPSGTAIQKAREKSGNPDFTRDGYHLDNIIGRYIAACTWFEAVFGESVVGNSFVPQGLSPAEARFAQEAAHEACLDPFGGNR